MLRSQVSPRAIAVVVVVILALVQLVYWRLLVYREPSGPPGPMGPGGPFPPSLPFVVGLEDAVVDTLAGDTPGYEDGPGWKARFCGPNALALTPDGTLLVADSRNHRIRAVDPAGVVRTVAGGGAPGGPGGRSEGPALEAQLRYPSGVAAHSDGTIFISDTGNGRICRVKDGTLSVHAASPLLGAPAALALGENGRLWVRDARGGAVRSVDPGGAVTTPEVPPDVALSLGTAPVQAKLAAWENTWEEPAGSQFAQRGRSPASWSPGRPIVVADPELQVLLVHRAGAAPALLAGRVTPEAPSPLVQDGPGHRVVFGVPCATAVAPDGTAYVAEYEGNRIRRVRLPRWLSEGNYVAPGRPVRWRRRSGD